MPTMETKAALWVPDSSDLSLNERQIVSDIKKKSEDKQIKENQDNKVPDLSPSEQEKIRDVTAKMQLKFSGMSSLSMEKIEEIEKEFISKLEDIGFVANIEWVHYAESNCVSPRAVITSRTEFDIDETAKLLHEVKKRKGYKLER